MKNILINNPKVIRDEKRSEAILQSLRERFDPLSIVPEGFELISDVPVLPTEMQICAIETIHEYVTWVLSYFNMILHNNVAADEKKKGPYGTFTSITLDTQNSKGKFYFYLDGDIFGLVVGSSYVNITSIIKASFPIFSKLDMDVEVKLFSLSEPEKDVF